MRPSRSRKRGSAVSVVKASLFERLRLGICLRWLAITGLIAMQSWLAYSSAAKAAGGDTYTWTGATSGNWSITTNWLGGNVPTGDIGGGSIVFDASCIDTWPNCGSDVSGIGSLSLSGKSYNLAGSGKLTFSSGGTFSFTGLTTGYISQYFSNDIVATGDLKVVATTTANAHFYSSSTAVTHTITLQNNATLTLDADGSSSIAIERHTITGDGSLVKTGAGDVTLYRACDYTGSTTINQGTLDAECIDALPSTTEVTIASAGTLQCRYHQTFASLSGAGGVYLDSGVTLTLTGSGDSTFSGTVLGYSASPAILTKTGSGTMTMTGSSTVSNVDVNVDGGTLEFNRTMTDHTMTVGEVDASTRGTLTGVGTVHDLVNNLGGTLAAGNAGNRYGTMTVTGSFTNNIGSNVEVYITAAGGGQSSKIAVTGTATIHGGTVHVHGASGSGFASGQTYTFLTCGSQSGAGFNSVDWDGLPTGMTATLGYVDVAGSVLWNIYLSGGRTYRERGVTFNQQAVGGYLDQHASGASGDFQTVLSTIDGLTDAQTQAAYNAMGGELFGSLSTIGLENTENFLQGLAQRLRGQSMTRGMAFATAQAKWDDSLLLVSRHESWLREKAEGWTTWAEGFGVGAKLASNGNASGLGYSTGGLSLGMEKWLEEDLLVGVAGGYSNTYTLLDERSDHGTIDAGHFAVYFQREFETRYLNGVAGYGYNAYDSLRHVTIGSLERTAEASYAGNSFSFYTEVGQNVRGRYVHLQPYAALEYIQLHQNGFTETGADSVNLSVGGVGADAFRGLLGTRVLSYLRTDAGQLITLEGRAAWRHEFLDDNRILDATFAGQTGTAYAIQGINVDRDAAILGTGLTYDMTKSLKFGLNYDLLFSSNYTAHAGSGNFTCAW